MIVTINKPTAFTSICIHICVHIYHYNPIVKTSVIYIFHKYSTHTYNCLFYFFIKWSNVIVITWKFVFFQLPVSSKPFIYDPLMLLEADLSHIQISKKGLSSNWPFSSWKWISKPTLNVSFWQYSQSYWGVMGSRFQYSFLRGTCEICVWEKPLDILFLRGSRWGDRERWAMNGERRSGPRAGRLAHSRRV